MGIVGRLEAPLHPYSLSPRPASPLWLSVSVRLGPEAACPSDAFPAAPSSVVGELDRRISPNLYPPPAHSLPLRIFVPPLLPSGSFGSGEIRDSTYETVAHTLAQ